jgi:hypothetical protein
VSAQDTAAAPEVAGRLGGRVRFERGETLVGAGFEGAIAPRPHGAVRWELALALAQMTAHLPVTGGHKNVRENSLELAARVERAIAGPSGRRIVGGLGVVLGTGLGCMGGGNYAADSGGGPVACVNDFARRGALSLGGDARLVAELGGGGTRLTIGAGAAVHTTAAGPGVSPLLLVGFRSRVR